MGINGRDGEPTPGSAGWWNQRRPACRRSPSAKPVCRNVTVSGRRTSLSLEPVFWSGLNDICAREGMTLNEVCSTIDKRRGTATLTGSVRVFVVAYFRLATPDTATPAAENAADESLPLRSAFDAIG